MAGKVIYNYLHSDYQNETIRIMAFILFCDIAKNINESYCYSVMKNDITDSRKVEQLVPYFWWVDVDLYVYEDFVTHAPNKGKTC